MQTTDIGFSRYLKERYQSPITYKVPYNTAIGKQFIGLPTMNYRQWQKNS